MLKLGMKVAVPAELSLGIGQVAAVYPHEIAVSFATSARGTVVRKYRLEEVKRRRIPEETRCYVSDAGVQRYGRVLMEHGLGSDGLLNYLVRLPESKTPVTLREDRFTVRSYLADVDGPIETLADLAHETPFFFEQRMDLLAQLDLQRSLTQGFTGLLSAKIVLFRHQIEVISRIGADPIIRYLLADEVGLGKTIETGVVLRQVLIDAPSTRIGVYVPGPLVPQWEGELSSRFGLNRIVVMPHEALLRADSIDLAVIDEAHQIVIHPELGEAARRLSRAVKHLLLLTATPGLHHADSLLALLQLLDPQNYSATKPEAFAELLRRRAEVGRAILALQNSTLPALVRRQIGLMAELLPSDGTVNKIVESSATAGDLKEVRDALLLHLTETYRIHRRMLRTRRVWLAESDRYFVRRMKVACEYEVDEEPYLRLWQILDEWRTTTAGRLANDVEKFALGAVAYLKIAETISGNPSDLPALIAITSAQLDATDAERQLLEEVEKKCDSATLLKGRCELAATAVKNRLARLKKGVIYAPSETVKQLEATLVRRLGKDRVLSAEKSRSSDAAMTVRSFVAGLHQVLVTDMILEEGFNLQCAEFVVFFDLPWSPYRIEQRIGRLDRIDRIGPIECAIIVSGEDETLCVDEAWRQLLSDGFGIFRQSISDLQHVIDIDFPQWREKLFAVGPSGIGELVAVVRTRVAEERRTIDEQDAIDGMGRTAQSGILEAGLRHADTAAADLQRSLSIYLKESIGLHQSWREVDNTIVFFLPRGESPRLPTERLGAIHGMLNRPVTTLRQVAVEAFEAEFLRPGHPAIAACESLLDWDDRGRAFVIWRPCPEFEIPRVVFRCLVRVSVDLRGIRETLEAQSWDAIERGGLLRLLTGWFADVREDVFLDADGAITTESIAAICRLPYEKPRDQSLGKERAAVVRAEFGAETWGAWCRTVAGACATVVGSGRTVTERREESLVAASRHFDLLRARLSARRSSGWESALAIDAELARQRGVEDLVLATLLHPTITLDSVGAYVLSSRPLDGSDSG